MEAGWVGTQARHQLRAIKKWHYEMNRSAVLVCGYVAQVNAGAR